MNQTTPATTTTTTPAAPLQSMRRCPKFSACSAPLCPLDPHHASRVMQGRDRACFWMLEAVKETHALPGEIAAEVREAVRVMPALPARAPLRHRLASAALTGSRSVRPPPVPEDGEGHAKEAQA